MYHSPKIQPSTCLQGISLRHYSVQTDQKMYSSYETLTLEKPTNVFSKTNLECGYCEGPKILPMVKLLFLQSSTDVRKAPLSLFGSWDDTLLVRCKSEHETVVFYDTNSHCKCPFGVKF